MVKKSLRHAFEYRHSFYLPNFMAQLDEKVTDSSGIFGTQDIDQSIFLQSLHHEAECEKRRTFVHRNKFYKHKYKKMDEKLNNKF